MPYCKSDHPDGLSVRGIQQPQGAVAFLLGKLRESGAREQAAALLARDPAAQVSLDDLGAVASLLGKLRESGADEQVTTLADRLPGAGMFELLLEQLDR